MLNTKKVKLSTKQRASVDLPFNHVLEVYEGTPRSGKTTALHFRYAKFLLETKDVNHLAIAFNQEQAFRLFIDGDGTGLMHIFPLGYLSELKHDELGDHLLIHTPNGDRRVYYKGGAKSNSSDAIQGMSLGSVAYGEINLLHLSMIQESFRRTFAASHRFHLADLNPPAPNHPVISEVFDVQDTRWSHWTIDDNPIITKQRKTEIFNTLSKNPYLLERDWYGRRTVPEGVIYAMYNNDKNFKQALMGEPVELFFSIDAGQSDATSASCNIVTLYEGKYRLNRVSNYYHSGKDTGQVKAMSTYAREIKDYIGYCINLYQLRYTDIIVDPSAKSLREELHKINVLTSKADNNHRDAKQKGGGIEVGIERGGNLISDERFYVIETPTEQYDHYNFIKEIGLYTRDDKTSHPIDTFNHSMDEFRYSVNYFYRKYLL